MLISTFRLGKRLKSLLSTGSVFQYLFEGTDNAATVRLFSSTSCLRKGNLSFPSEILQLVKYEAHTQKVVLRAVAPLSFHASRWSFAVKFFKQLSSHARAHSLSLSLSQLLLDHHLLLTGKIASYYSFMHSTIMPKLSELHTCNWRWLWDCTYRCIVVFLHFKCSCVYFLMMFFCCICKFRMSLFILECPFWVLKAFSFFILEFISRTSKSDLFNMLTSYLFL